MTVEKEFDEMVDAGLFGKLTYSEINNIKKHICLTHNLILEGYKRYAEQHYNKLLDKNDNL